MPYMCNYAVGASRLAYLSKPVWCLNQQPVDLTMTDIEQSSANFNLNDVAMFMIFSTPSRLTLWEDSFDQFACESPWYADMPNKIHTESCVECFFFWWFVIIYIRCNWFVRQIHIYERRLFYVCGSIFWHFNWPANALYVFLPRYKKLFI
jgi:hypothetical protein